jgi:sugar/nucleoside kinase (ribokinase family)
MPGVEELLNISQADSIEHGLEILFCNPKLEVVALKKGSQGCSIITRQEQFDLGVYPVSIKDTTGAGDNFLAGVAYGLYHGWPMDQCMKMGNAVGGYSATALGCCSAGITLDIADRLMNDIGQAVFNPGKDILDIK